MRPTRPKLKLETPGILTQFLSIIRSRSASDRAADVFTAVSRDARADPQRVSLRFGTVHDWFSNTAQTELTH
jgi:hypothetical protein